MVKILKDCMNTTITDWRENFVKKNKEMDIIHEISKCFLRIILSCAFGEDFSEELID